MSGVPSFLVRPSARPSAQPSTRPSAQPSAQPSTGGTVVVLHAHPDDEAIFTGVTVRRLADAGVRVVLVTATNGDAGLPRQPLRRGERLRHRRTAELERACELLGVARLVLLGYEDSGCHDGPFGRRSLGAARTDTVVATVADVAEAEGAQALVHDDARGIYGHVDHVQVHRAGARAAARLGLTSYETTVDAAWLARTDHLVREADQRWTPIGVDPERVSLTVRADGGSLAAKWAAMTAHASQIGPEHLRGDGFAEQYGTEWFVRRGRPTVLDRVLGTAGGRQRGPDRSVAARG